MGITLRLRPVSVGRHSSLAAWLWERGPEPAVAQVVAQAGADAAAVAGLTTLQTHTEALGAR
eukprot:10341835-Alexandrium_andersonii.AAC.1